MKNTLRVTENAVVSMDSREIAELTGKEHKNVTVVIESLIADQILTAEIQRLNFDQPSFRPIEFHSPEFSGVYKDQQLIDAGKISCVYW